ncbi:MAG: ABC transporter ATP-binding protein [Micrococcaceae bacterium]
MTTATTVVLPTARPGRPAVVGTGLAKTYRTRARQQVRAVEDATVTFDRGTVTGIVGPSGSGKTTLLHLLAGLERPDKGSVTIGGIDITRLPERRLARLRRERMGFVFQSYQLLPHLTAARNIELPLRLNGQKASRDEIVELSALMGIEDRLDHLPTELSGGQQQRVAIARALVNRPDVIFADEPSGALDNRLTAELMGLLRLSADSRGQAVVIVTHDERVTSYCDRVLRMDTGWLE